MPLCLICSALPDSSVVTSNVANLEENPSFSATELTPFLAYILKTYAVRESKFVTVALVWLKFSCLGRKRTCEPQS